MINTIDKYYPEKLIAMSLPHDAALPMVSLLAMKRKQDQLTKPTKQIIKDLIRNLLCNRASVYVIS